METLECIKTRRSIRKFKDELVPIEVVNEAIDAVRYSPSWKNTFVSRFYLVNDKTKIDYIANGLVRGFEWNKGILLGTRNLIVVAAKKGRSGVASDGSFESNKENAYMYFDNGIATSNLTLALHDLGLASVILGIIDYEGIHSYLELPEDIEVVALLPFGYGIEKPNEKVLRPQEKIFKIL